MSSVSLCNIKFGQLCLTHTRSLGHRVLISDYSVIVFAVL
jgi:hypothetical protein